MRRYIYCESGSQQRKARRKQEIEDCFILGSCAQTEHEARERGSNGQQEDDDDYSNDDDDGDQSCIFVPPEKP